MVYVQDVVSVSAGTLTFPEIMKLFGATKLPTKPSGKPTTLASKELPTV